jgi:hypothetical protein
MKMIFIGVVFLLLIVVAVLLYKDYYVNLKFRKLAAHKYKFFEPLMKKLSSSQEVTEAEILPMAKDPSMRIAVFRILEAYGRKHLFPAEYFTHEKGAESFLVNWLEFPTELGIAPHEITLFTKITLEESEALDYYVFRYRTIPPHWAAQYNWMMGVSGPYFEKSKPYDVPFRVFSRFNEVGSVPAENEVRWVHENIGNSQG